MENLIFQRINKLMPRRGVVIARDYWGPDV